MKDRMLNIPNKFSVSFWVWIRKNKIFLMVREKSSNLLRNYDNAPFLVKGGQDFY